MGVKSGKVLKRYTHFAVEDLRDAVVDLDEKRTEKDAVRFHAARE